VTSVTNNI